MKEELLIGRLKQAFGRKKMVFFVGAGISVDSKLPDFKGLSEKVIRLATGSKLNRDQYASLSQNIRPEVILQIAVEELGREVLECMNILVSNKPNTNHFLLADALARGNWVFTTNVDNLIEEACRLSGVKVSRCYSDLHFEQFANSLWDANTIPGGYLFKLHGTIEDSKAGEERFKTILVALRQVGRGLSEPKRTVLEYFLTNFDFWFMGYSCLDDFSVVPVLLETPSRKAVYWLSFANSPLGEAVTRRKSLRYEKELEERKLPGAKIDWGTINVNNFLLTRGKFYKLIGDSSAFVRDELCLTFSIKATPPAKLAKGQGIAPFISWAKDISDFAQHVFAGRLFEHLRRWDEVEKYFKKALDVSKDKRQEATGKRRLADLYYRQDVWDKEEAAIAIYRECSDIFKDLQDKDLQDDLEEATLKVDISNVLRRRGEEYYPEAKRHAEEAKERLQPIRAKSDEHMLSYARCINVLGLACWALGRLTGKDLKVEEYSEAANYLDKAYALCSESRKLKDKLGDRDGVAESDNALGLVRIEEGKWLAQIGKQFDVYGLIKQANRKFDEAINHLQKAIDARKRYSYFRGCAQHCRNIGDAFKELMKLAESSLKSSYFQMAKRSYEDGIAYWRLIRPAPLGEILHYKQRIAELYIDLADLTQDSNERKLCCMEIASIYSDVVYSDTPEAHIMLTEIRTNPTEFKTAKEVLTRTRESYRRLGLSFDASRIGKMIEDLLRDYAV